MVVTDGAMSKIVEGPDMIVNCPLHCIKQMGEWYHDKHSKSGLIDKARRSRYRGRDTEPYFLDFLQNECGIGKGKAPICGNGVHYLMIFIKKDMPKLYDYLSPQYIDIGTIRLIT